MKDTKHTSGVTLSVYSLESTSAADFFEYWQPGSETYAFWADGLAVRNPYFASADLDLHVAWDPWHVGYGCDWENAEARIVAVD